MKDDFSCNACGGDPCTCRPDPVNHPAHYTTHPSGIECIQLAEHMNFCRGNALKYLFRAGVKGLATELEDLKKARWYLDREIGRLERGTFHGAASQGPPWERWYLELREAIGAHPFPEPHARAIRHARARMGAYPDDATPHPETLMTRNIQQKENTMKSAKKAAKSKSLPVIVTTAHRGVFFGYADKVDGETISLKKARLCVYWSSDVKGFMGLASAGPSSQCRIGPAADITLRNITAVLAVTPAAVKAWKAAPWKA